VVLNVVKESSKDLSESAVLYGGIHEIHMSVIVLKMNDEGIAIIAFLPFDKIA